MFVRRVASLRDHALPSIVAGVLPRFLIRECLDAAERGMERQFAQQRATFVERQPRHVAAIEP